jgi:hypothetical protein
MDIVVKQPQWFFKKEEMKAHSTDKFVFIARDWKSANGKMVKQFAALDSHAQLLQYIQTLICNGGDSCLYELIQHNSPCRLYFDLEWTGGSDTSAAETITAIAHAIDTLLQELSDTARTTPELRKCEILKSSRHDQTKGVVKHSFHLVYPGVTVHNNTLAMQCIAGKIHARCEQLNAQTDKNPVDMSVYSRDRLFRTPLSCKATDPTRTPLLLSDNASTHTNERLLSCFVTNVSHTGICIGLGLGGSTIKPELVKMKHSKTRQSCAQPHPKTLLSAISLAGSKVNVPKLEKRLQRIILASGGLARVRFHRITETTGFLLFRLEHRVGGRPEPCLAHGIASNITHKNDNQLLSVDINGLVRVICPHKGKCNNANYMLCRIEPRYFLISSPRL